MTIFGFDDIPLAPGTDIELAAADEQNCIRRTTKRTLRKLDVWWHRLTTSRCGRSAFFFACRYDYVGHHIAEMWDDRPGYVEALVLTTAELFNIPPVADLLEAAKHVLAGDDLVGIDELRAAVAVAAGDAEVEA